MLSGRRVMSVKIKNDVWEVKWKLKRDYVEFMLRTVDYKWRVKRDYVEFRIRESKVKVC